MTVNPQKALVELSNDFSASLTGIDLEQLIYFCLKSVVVLLRGRRADIEKISKSRHLPHQLEEFRLPIFKSISGELDSVFRKLRSLGMLPRLIDICEPTENPVSKD